MIPDIHCYHSAKEHISSQMESTTAIFPARESVVAVDASSITAQSLVGVLTAHNEVFPGWTYN